MKNFKISQSITDRRDISLSAYFKDVSRYSLLTPEEETELAIKARDGDQEAANKLVEHNLRFIISVAKAYQGKGLPLVDLIQEGAMGALEATKKFNPTKGFKFISYAVWWIRQSIMKAISEQGRTVRLPMSQVININKINKVTDKFEQCNGRKPSIEELEKETNLNATKIGKTMAITNYTVSLESPIKDDEAGCLLDIVPNNNVDPLDQNLYESDLHKEIERILTKLSYRDRDVLRMSFGLGMQPIPNEEIARKFGIGGERVRQIIKSSIKKIRENHSNVLKGMYR